MSKQTRRKAAIAFQKQNGVAHPFSEEDKIAYSEFIENQVTLFEVKTKGNSAIKQRSWQQFKLFHAAIRVVVTNTEEADWNTVAKAKLKLKVLLNYVNEDAIVYDEKKRQVVVQYRSFGYDALPHMEACDVFNRAWPILAGVIGITKQQLIEAAKSKEYDRGLK